MDIDIAITNEFWDEKTERDLFLDNEGRGNLPLRLKPTESFDMLDLLVLKGIFASRSQARKAGWLPGWPPGWTDTVVGKKRIRICIWNPLGPLDSV